MEPAQCLNEETRVFLEDFFNRFDRFDPSLLTDSSSAPQDKHPSSALSLSSPALNSSLLSRADTSAFSTSAGSVTSLLSWDLSSAPPSKSSDSVSLASRALGLFGLSSRFVTMQSYALISSAMRHIFWDPLPGRPLAFELVVTFLRTTGRVWNPPHAKRHHASSDSAVDQVAKSLESLSDQAEEKASQDGRVPPGRNPRVLNAMSKIRTILSFPVKVHPNVSITPITIPPLKDAPKHQRHVLEAEWVCDIESSHSDSAILYLHGGGYCAMSPATHRGLVAKLSKASKCKVLAVDYRLAPEHPFPAALEDAIRAYHHITNKEAGFAPCRVALAGDSAGGGLCMALLIALRDAGLSKDQMPVAAFLMSPWVDLECKGESWTKNADTDYLAQPSGTSLDMASFYVGGRYSGIPLNHPLVSPVNASLHDLPPLYIQAGGAETLVDDARLLKKRAEFYGVQVELVEYPNMVHVFQAFFEILPLGREAIKEGGRFVRRMCRSRDAEHVEGKGQTEKDAGDEDEDEKEKEKEKESDGSGMQRARL